MPTGYTSPVREGEVTTLKDFALLCARAFGSTIEFRDLPLDAEIESKINEIGQSNIDYHAKELERAEERLAEVESMTFAEAKKAAQEDYDARLASYESGLVEQRTTRARYEAMLAKVEAWEAPTSDHADFHKFMQDQLKESLRFDCDYAMRGKPDRVPLAEWVEEKVLQAKKRVEYHKDGLEKANETAKSSRKWLTDLIASVSEKG